MQLLTKEIAKFLEASCIEILLLKFKYLVRLALQMVGFEQLSNVSKKAISEK